MKQKGFTLIELMIVVAILGILLSIAVPTYQDHIVKTKVMEGLNLAAAAKIAVTEAAFENHTLPNQQENTGYISPKATENVQSIRIGQQGVITIQYTSSAGGGTILFVPNLHENGDITWRCREGTLAAKYRPSQCR